MASQPRGDLVRYEDRSGQFVPYLSGIFASELDFSRDSQWITYVAYPENTLWRCRADGGDRVQLTYPPAEAHLPRWSPDGSQIAFTTNHNAKWKIFLIPAQGGTPKELLPQHHDDEADPVFSPDSRTARSLRSDPGRTKIVPIPSATTACEISEATGDASRRCVFSSACSTS